ncbi:MAG: hypothetical protein J3Q66DRAFT_372707 [Benniella sp.]|nr:MAG: hypothetical protein J3Q66DRAFT_372707 [Benniella sp.]
MPFEWFSTNRQEPYQNLSQPDGIERMDFMDIHEKDYHGCYGQGGGNEEAPTDRQPIIQELWPEDADPPAVPVNEKISHWDFSDDNKEKHGKIGRAIGRSGPNGLIVICSNWRKARNMFVDVDNDDARKAHMEHVPQFKQPPGDERIKMLRRCNRGRNRNEQGVDQMEEDEDGEGGDKEEEDAAIRGKHNGGYH